MTRYPDPKMPQRVRVVVLVWIASLVLLAVTLVYCSVARAHSWYEGQSNPVTGSGCCGAVDCFQLADEDVKQVAGGWSYRMPDGVWYTIPANEVLPSNDGFYHGCARGGGREQPPYLCFFVPLTF
jgi:hypothetical protein